MIDENGESGKSNRDKFYETMGTASLKAVNNIDVNNQSNMYKGLYMVAQYRVENGFNTSPPNNNPFNVKGKGDAGRNSYKTTEHIKGVDVKL